MHKLHIFVIIAITALSGCGTILRADFESNTAGSTPGADLPASPAGDRLNVPALVYGTVFVIEETGSGEETHHERRVDNRADRSQPGWPTSVSNGIDTLKFISRPINFPDRPIATTLRAKIKSGSGRLEMYLGNDENCAAIRLRYDDDKLTLLSSDSGSAFPLGELLRVFDSSITLLVNRGENKATAITA